MLINIHLRSLSKRPEDSPGLVLLFNYLGQARDVRTLRASDIFSDPTNIAIIECCSICLDTGKFVASFVAAMISLRL